MPPNAGCLSACSIATIWQHRNVWFSIARRRSGALAGSCTIEIIKSTAWPPALVKRCSDIALPSGCSGGSRCCSQSTRPRACSFLSTTAPKIQLLEPGHVHGLQVLHHQLQLWAQRVLPADGGATRNCAHPEARCRLAACLHGLHRLRLD